MEEPTVLRTARMGGFVKEDVMTYLDELNSKIISLEEELKAAKAAGPASDSQELTKARNQVDNLQEKLNASNNALRAAKKENEDLKKQIEEDQKVINQLRSAGGAQGNAQQTTAALEAAKREIDTLRAKLKTAEEKAAAAPQGGAPNVAANAQTTQALEAAKREIDNLRAKLKAAEDKAATAAHNAPQGGAPAQGAQAQGSSEELNKAKQEITKISNELAAKVKELADKTAALEAKTKESADKDAKLTQITKEKDEQISKLNDEISDLKENGGMIPSSFDMGALFTEAQKTAGKITIEAQRNAEKVTKEANEKADQIIKDANAEAEKTITNANVTAETCIKEANDQARATVAEANAKAKNAVDDANAQAKATVDQANDKAKATVDEANAHADKVNELSTTVRSMLLNEIDSINNKFADINAVLSRMSSQASDRMNEAELIIGEAKKTVDSTETAKEIKKADAPRAEFKPVEVPQAVAREAELPEKAVKSSDPFAEISNSSSFNTRNNNINNNSNNSSFNKPASAPANNQAANQQSHEQNAKKNTNFNFDMAALLKAAEEEAAKETPEQ